MLRTQHDASPDNQELKLSTKHLTLRYWDFNQLLVLSSSV